jgi:hypothetical protein
MCLIYGIVVPDKRMVLCFECLMSYSILRARRRRWLLSFLPLFSDKPDDFAKDAPQRYLDFRARMKRRNRRYLFDSYMYPVGSCLKTGGRTAARFGFSP